MLKSRIRGCERFALSEEPKEGLKLEKMLLVFARLLSKSRRAVPPVRRLWKPPKLKVVVSVSTFWPPENALRAGSICECWLTAEVSSGS